MVNSSGEGKEVGSRYSLVVAVAKRAKQLREGAPRLVECRSRNPITIALEEIAAGKITMVLPTAEEIESARVEKREIRMGAKTGARATAELLRISKTEEDEEPVEAISTEEAAEPTTAVIEAEPEAEPEPEPKPKKSRSKAKPKAEAAPEETTDEEASSLEEAESDEA